MYINVRTAKLFPRSKIKSKHVGSITSTRNSSTQYGMEWLENGSIFYGDIMVSFHPPRILIAYTFFDKPPTILMSLHHSTNFSSNVIQYPGLYSRRIDNVNIWANQNAQFPASTEQNTLACQ